MFVLLSSFVFFGHYVTGQVTSHTSCPNDWTVHDGSCYHLDYDNKMSFLNAENYCKLEHGHLVHVETAAENDFIVHLLNTSKAKSCWLGLTDMDEEGTWVWHGTQTAPQFTYWWPREPHGGDGEDCAVYLARHSNYNWDDYPCSHHFHPLCEYTPGTDVIG